ncbi:MAG: calcium/sodium antiporter [Clostridiales bacterium]|uniref:calcium/sodium antiporter n=1 Tax=Terrisporobacter sp. TaxID=1965305 RepID=UPI002A576B4B|nr:calcium/sodium antiporter [Terrisporobacter sp.]MCI5630319.1 calcium/sodium antiporter [Clostridium sp.]MDD7754406.1 calcium/sodium antiporter [Clostridiales bacterium]MCI6457616.1 calcium/sodium antiporter [Clostridium sp.]MDY4135347.1 calcium/sodium antiporter [Terrisporobacter sp.]MDY4737264.1 calcium/sodium antiporter [Terrisporobacter sp.]
MTLVIILFFVGFFLITKGADIFIDCTVKIGRKTGISELILGATIVSFATTLPELTVSVFASIDNYTTMSLGNAVGSIICNTGLILGLVVIISPFKVDKNMFSSKSIILLISVLTLMVLGANGSISRGDGFILIVLLIVFMYSNIKSVSGKNRINSPNNMQSNSCDNIKSSKHENLKVGVLFVLGLIMMVVGSKLLVDNGVKIANSIGVPQGIISLTVIALGTSLPELVSSLTAIKKKHHGISVGNILGANILNIVSVIGISSLINDLPILSQNMRIDFEFMTIILLILILPTIKSGKLYRVQGLLLLSSYIIYITTLYFMYLA